MSSENPRVLVGCPITSYKKNVMNDYVEGVKNLTYPNKEIWLVDNSPNEEMFEELQKEKAFGINVVKSEHIENIREMLVRDRNWLREKCLNEGFDYFFSLEQDVIPPANVVEKLLENRKEICGAAYFGFFYAEVDGKKVKDLHPIYYKLSNPKSPDVRVIRKLLFEEAFPSRLMEVDAGGVGALLIRRNVLEKIAFGFEKEMESFDDVKFADDCYANGFKLWMDSRLICLHLHEEWDIEWKKRAFLGAPRHE